MLKLDEFYEQEFLKRSMPFGAGRCALIMEGGTCLTQDLLQRPRGANVIAIAINHHCNILFPSFAVAEDPELAKLVKDSPNTKIFGRHKLADIDIAGAPNWYDSGINAVWLADYLDFDQIVLAGFDCSSHQTRSYWHDKERAKASHAKKNHLEVLEVWEDLKDNLCNPQNVYAISKELKHIFKEWKV